MSDLNHQGILGMKWGRRKASSVKSNTSRSGKSKTKAKMSLAGKKQFMANQRKKKVKELLKQQNVQDTKRLTSHLMTGFLTLNASKWANEAATPGSQSYNQAYAEWLKTG